MTGSIRCTIREGRSHSMSSATSRPAYILSCTGPGTGTFGHKVAYPTREAAERARDKIKTRAAQGKRPVYTTAQTFKSPAERKADIARRRKHR